ncbi:LysR substrate-binding domain-containing protein [Halopseudomonas aestusnigri]|jgi:DNA-binding transcriptional LysR family regulator|uniref:LysR substrate-binding domain-containing protein n=1 Tax=Halopseudomonas TaxID=2901189 RepID=UPI000C68584C|nr:LysR substrate-binding domain-containing protein [Halopseudomonas aestusnigri]MAK74490.1 LysR family transcriptional regulator [Pseudomonadales bacterium]MEE2800482.1 LysR substrate-binding domain-containing protein [Pseudomonadota bacterium]HCP03302.1 LysR family transcriptional regulator [Pseudomonas sp.]MAP76173.1 LysR family transcriptional regulator [Pseudomonadales bacterium]MAY08216.1 LysR family transcriptional regulator [Pseudomonadales bacterium]|tara:strand:+ start:1015 stop:1914 length:900 start_codon:yes stop_codon:yes gene_type:complete
MSDWEGIDEFVAVAETGHFTGAAARLGVSSSHVSRQIARLEDRLQSRLFYRSTRRVSLTEAGQTFLQHCQRLIDARDEALQAITDLGSEPKGLLRMTCAVAYGESFIMPLVNDFMQQHPQLRVEMTLTNQTLDLLHGSYDLAIRLGRLQDSSLIATRIAPRHMYLCAAPSYLERFGAPHSLSELPRHNCLIGSSDVWSFQQRGRELPVRVQGNWRCNSGQAVLDAALRGFGLCQLPDYYVQEHLRSGSLRALLPQHQPPHTAVWALYPQQRHLSPKVRQLVDYLKQGLAQRSEYRTTQL